MKNVILTTPFSEKEVFEAISQMKNNKAPGPDEFLGSFIRDVGTLLKWDLFPMFHDLVSGQL